jgi:hypothetical protein
LRVWDASKLGTSNALVGGYYVREGQQAGITNLSSIDTIGTPNSIHQFFVVGNTAYISHYTQGFRVLDISNPSNPVEIGYHDNFPQLTITSGPYFFRDYNWTKGVFGVHPDPNRTGIVYCSGSDGLYIYAVHSIMAQENKSASPNASGLTTQRSVLRDASNIFHMVYSSGGEIFYRSNEAEGTGLWSAVRHLIQGGNNEYPSIARSGNNLVAVWQDKKNDNNQYSVIYSRSTNNGTSWSSPQTLPGSNNISSAGEGPVPVIASNGSGGFMVVYRQNNRLVWSHSSNNGLSWSSIATVSSTNSNSARPGLTYDAQTSRYVLSYEEGGNLIYVQKGTSSGWSSRLNIKTMSNSNNKFTSITPPDGTGSMHVVWQSYNHSAGWQTILQRRTVCDAYEGTISCWSPATEFITSETRELPVAGAHSQTSGGVTILFHHANSDIIRRVYTDNNQNWNVTPSGGTPPVVANGEYANIIDRAASTSGLWFLYTKASGPPHQLQTNIPFIPLFRIAGDQYTAEENNKFEYWRRIEVTDSSRTNGFSFTLKGLYQIDEEGNAIEIPLINPIISIGGSSFVLDGGSGGDRIGTYDVPGNIRGSNSQVDITFSDTPYENYSSEIVHVYYSHGEEIVDETGNSIDTYKAASDVSLILPKEYSIFNYPNPFNPSTILRYTLPEDTHVRIVVFDMLGRMVNILVDEFKDAGYHQVIFDAGNIASGIYFYKIETKNFTDAKKMILIR